MSWGHAHNELRAGGAVPSSAVQSIYRILPNSGVDFAHPSPWGSAALRKKHQTVRMSCPGRLRQTCLLKGNVVYGANIIQNRFLPATHSRTFLSLQEISDHAVETAVFPLRDHTRKKLVAFVCHSAIVFTLVRSTFLAARKVPTRGKNGQD